MWVHNPHKKFDDSRTREIVQKSGKNNVTNSQFDWNRFHNQYYYQNQTQNQNQHHNQFNHIGLPAVGRTTYGLVHCVAV